MPDDRELARFSARGDKAAFHALVERHVRYLYGVAYALSGNAADAEDIVQETLAGAWSGGFRGESSVRTWLVGILVRRAAMLRRSQRRHGRAVALDADAADVAVEAAATDVTAKLDLATMLAGLSVEHRAVIVLRELEGMSYQEMAEALGVPQGTIESRLHRARAELRGKYRGYL